MGGGGGWRISTIATSSPLLELYTHFTIHSTFNSKPSEILVAPFIVGSILLLIMENLEQYIFLRGYGVVNSRDFDNFDL